MATEAELSQLRKDLYKTIRNPIEGKMAGKIVSGIMMAANLAGAAGVSEQWVIDQAYLQADDIAGLASEQWVQSQNYLTNITGLTADNSDQLGGVDAINYARTDVAETFNANVTIGAGAIISGNGSGLTNIDATTLNGKAASAYYNNIDNLVPWSEIFQAPDIPSAGDTSNWNAAYNDKINSIAFNTANGVVTFTQQDASVLAVDLDGRYRTDPQFITFDAITNNIGLIDSAETINLDSVYITIGTAIDATTLNGKAASAYYNNIDNLVPWSEIFQAPDFPSVGDTSNWNAAYNDSITAVGFATGTGVLTLTQRDASVLTVDLDGRYRTDPQFITFDAITNNISLSDSAVNINLDSVYLAAGANISELTNDSGYITSASLSPVATSGDYTDLINTPSDLAFTNVDNDFSVGQTINGVLTVDTSTNRMFRLDADYVSGSFSTISIYRQGAEKWREILGGNNEYEIWSEEGGTNTRLKILQNGNIKINGSGIPTEKIDVNGNVKATSFIGSGASLTSVDADQLNGVDAVNYARTDVAETFNANVTIGVGATISGNGSGLTNLDADTLGGVAAGAYAKTLDLSPVATSGDYTDLINTPPSISSGDISNWNAAYNDKINSIAFNTSNGVVTFTQQDASVLTVDLDGRYRTDPQFITFDAITNNISLSDSAVNINLDSVYLAAGANISQLTNDSGYITSASLAPVATSNSYTDLINTPSNLAKTNVNNNFSAGQTINGALIVDTSTNRMFRLDGDFVSGGFSLKSIYRQGAEKWREVLNSDNEYEIWSEEGGTNTRLSIQQNGNIKVGGGASATEKLEVAGNVKATSFIGSGASLTGVDADQLNGVDAINYARTNLAETFLDDVTIDQDLWAKGELRTNLSLLTGAPSGKTAYKWKFGGASLNAVTLVTDNSLWVEVYGTLYQVALVETDLS